jgi:hypothetical protein
VLRRTVQPNLSDEMGVRQVTIKKRQLPFSFRSELGVQTDGRPYYSSARGKP